MARQIDERIIIEGILEAVTPLHIGGAEGESCDTDMPLCVNGKGDYYIPGTSLAGAFKSWMEGAFDKDIVKCLWGFQEQKGSGGQASYIIVDDSVISNYSPVEVRDGVGINPDSGTSADGYKYDTAIIPKGAKLTLNMTVDICRQNGKKECKSISKDDASYMVGSLLEALELGRIRLGASKARGLGKVKLLNNDTLEKFSVKLSTREGLLDFLGGKKGNFDLNHKSELKKTSESILNIIIGWKPTEPLMVKSGADGIAVDMIPLTSAVDKDNISFLLPGSSIKGVLRSQAFRILQTLCRQEEDGYCELKDAVNKYKVIQAVFGSKNAAKSKDNPPADNLFGIGNLMIDDCYAVPRFITSDWKEVSTAEDDGEVLTKLKACNLLSTDENNKERVKTDISHHVGIDRWTGGAADGYLYSQLEPHNIGWEPIQMVLNLSRIEDNLKMPATALILFLLRDLQQNRIQFGFGANRGMGSIGITDITFDGENMPRALSFLNGMKHLGSDSILGIGESNLGELDIEWKKYIQGEGGDK